jgi:hypothetical protein
MYDSEWQEDARSSKLLCFEFWPGVAAVVRDLLRI